MQDQSESMDGGRRFRLGARHIALAVGFAATVLVGDLVLERSDYRVLVPPQVEQNQIQLFAHLRRPEPEDVLVIGSSRVLEGIDPNLITEILSYRPERPVETVRLPVQGMRAWTLTEILRELVAPRPPRDLLVVALEARYFYFLPDETARPLGFQMLASTEDLFTTDLTALDVDQLRELSLAPLRGVRAPWVLPEILLGRTDEYVRYLHETRGLPAVNFKPLGRREFELARALRDEIAERDASFESLELRGFDVDTFLGVLDELAALPCPVVFVRLPVAIEFDLDQRRQLGAFQRRVVEPVLARGFEYHDLNVFGQLRQPGLFENPSHLNDRGRELASRILALTVIGPAVLGPPPPGVVLPEPEPWPPSSLEPSPAEAAGPAAGAENTTPTRDQIRRRADAIFQRDDLSDEERDRLIEELRQALPTGSGDG